MVIIYVVKTRNELPDVIMTCTLPRLSGNIRETKDRHAHDTFLHQLRRAKLSTNKREGNTMNGLQNKVNP